MLPHIKFLVKNFDSKLLKEIYNELDDLSDIYELINSSIEDEPPLQ